MKHLAFTVLLLGLPAALPAEDAPLDVVASFSIIADLAEAVGGDRVDVHPLIGPEASAHDHEPRPADAVALAGADLVLINGLGFDAFIDRLITASGTAAPIVTLSEGIDVLTDPQGRADPHAWQSPANLRVYVDNIAEAFCAADAAGCDSYRNNAQGYATALDTLDADIRARFDIIPEPARIVVVPHDAFRYFGAAYGVRFLAPQGVAPEAEASAADVAALIREMRAEDVRAVFGEAGESTALVAQIAREAGVEVAGMLWSDTLSGPGGEAATCLEMMRHNAEVIAAALGD